MDTAGRRREVEADYGLSVPQPYRLEVPSLWRVPPRHCIDHVGR